MPACHSRRRPLPAFLLALAVLAGTGGAARADSAQQRLDRVFQPWANETTPGCVVGVAQPGQAPRIHAYGMADLERTVPLKADSVLEAGSVSKQFTAAAVMVLVHDGKLRLTDNVRTVVPELPDYGSPITIEQLLNHTSGLRDWGTVGEIAGRSRSNVQYDHDRVLEIIHRQRKLNYQPGAEFSYTNTGYNLLAIIVERVSGQTLNAFSRQRLFEPLNMNATMWRDDFRRLVPGRALAYGKSGKSYALDQPMENVYGNGGLLTTAADLLTWNAALDSGALAALIGPDFTVQGKLNDGHVLQYARGLFVSTYRDQREIAHSGATAGYRAWLARFPDRHLSVALLCNRGDANPGVLGHMVADIFLDDAPPMPVPPPAGSASPPAGLFVNTATGEFLRLVADGPNLRMGGRLFPPYGGDVFSDGFTKIRFTQACCFELESGGETTRFQAATPLRSPAESLSAYEGSYTSPDLELTFTVVADGARLRVERPAAAPVLLTPGDPDGFEGADGVTVRFQRDKRGQVSGMDFSAPRVRHLGFERKPRR